MDDLARHISPSYRLGDVPSSAFSQLDGLLNLSSGPDRLKHWIDIVHHYQLYNRQLPHALGYETPSSFGIDGISIFSPPVAGKGRFVCHKCPTRLGARKEFIRHMEQKCELVQEWGCPTCGKTYRRLDHLREHHKKKHHCNETKCAHLEMAKRSIPQKSRLGCGYCVRHFGNAQDFVKHLADHFKKVTCDPVWNDTRSIESLLQHPEIQPTWFNICADRFHGPAWSWPNLSWIRGSVAVEVRSLEYGVRHHDLERCLASLLEKRLPCGGDNQPFYTSTSVDKFAIDMPDRTTNVHNAADNYPSNRWPHIITSIDDTVENASIDPIDILNSTPTTLVNSEDRWVTKRMPASDWLALTPEMTTTSPPTGFNTSFDSSSDEAVISTELRSSSMDVDLSTFHADMRNWISNRTSIDLPSFDPSPVEDIILGSIPVSYPDTAGRNDVLLLVDNFTVTPMDIVFPPQEVQPHESSGSATALTPPFNPTMPLEQLKGHRRSISGRFLRAIQNFPSIPPTY